MKILVINPFGGTEFYGRDNLKKVANNACDKFLGLPSIKITS